MNNPLTLSERIHRYLDVCPPAISGQHGHDRTFAIACALINGFGLAEEVALRHLELYNRTCEPPWSHTELRHKIRSALGSKHLKPRGHLLNGTDVIPEPAVAAASPVLPLAPDWPEPDPGLIERIVKYGLRLADLWDMSPIRLESEDKSHSCAEDVIDILFPGNPLLCCGRTSWQFATRRREIWRGHLGRLPLMVPSACLRIQGPTKDGKPSEHCLSITACRAYLVIEFDFRAQDDEGPATCLEPLITLWRRQGITTLDASASLHAHLAERLPLVLVVHSGAKSLHAWFNVLGHEETHLKKSFMNYAVRLGADRATWVRSQFVRIPSGLRQSGERQRIWYFDPSKAIQP
jgi:hypothetical protein